MVIVKAPSCGTAREKCTTVARNDSGAGTTVRTDQKISVSVVERLVPHGGVAEVHVNRDAPSRATVARAANRVQPIDEVHLRVASARHVERLPSQLKRNREKSCGSSAGENSYWQLPDWASIRRRHSIRRRDAARLRWRVRSGCARRTV